MRLVNLLFFYNKFNKSSFGMTLKVLLHKKPKIQWVMANMSDGCIETHGRAFSFEAPLEFVDVDNNSTLVVQLNCLKKIRSRLVRH
jgi:hypothetical protein